MGPAPAMVSKLMSFRAPVSSAEGLELGDGLDLVGRARLAFGGQPVEQAHHRHGVSPVGAPGPLDLHGILGGAGQGARVGRGHDGGTGFPQRLEVEGRGLARIDQHPLAREGLQRGRQRLRRLQRHAVAEPGTQGLGLLGRVKEQAGRAVAAQDRLGQGQGRALHVAAPHVEQPRDGGGGGDEGRIRSGAGHLGGDAAALVGRVFAGNLGGVGRDGGQGLRRPVGPGCVDRIGLHGLERGAGLVGGRPQARQGIGAVEPRIVADHRLRRQALHVGGHAAHHQIPHLEQGRIDLRAHLQGIATVHEHGGRVAGHHRRPGRAGEARGPGQPLIGLGQILVLVLVLVRDDEGIQPLPLHLRPYQRQVQSAEGGVGGLVEGLAHAGLLGRGRAAAKRWSRSQPGLRSTSVAQASRWMRRSSRMPWPM